MPDPTMLASPRIARTGAEGRGHSKQQEASVAERRSIKSKARVPAAKVPPPKPRDLREAAISRGDPITYRVREVMAQLGIGRTKLYGLIGSGRLPAYSHDGVTLILRKDIEAYVADPAKRLPVRAQKAAQ